MNRSSKPDLTLSVSIDNANTRSRSEAEQIRLLRTLIGTIPDLIWLKDLEGVYLACNPMFERFFGAKEAAIIGRTDYDFVDAELADFFREHDRKAVSAVAPCVNLEWVTFADDGHRALLETIKSAMRDDEGRLIGVLGIARDITGIHESQVKLEAQVAELRRWQDATLGREMRILELKREVNALLGEQGQPPRYASAEIRGDGDDRERGHAS
jgi:PAS domain S-box-containing protein